MASISDSADSVDIEELNVKVAEKLEGAAGLLKRLEDQAPDKPATTSELLAIRSLIEDCIVMLDKQSLSL